MSTIFADVEPWPENPSANPNITMGHNNPPLEDRVMLEFAEDLEREGLTARIQELVESAGRVPDITSDAIAGKVGDLCKLARDVEKRVNDAREKHNRPLLNAQRTLKGKADGVLHPLLVAISDVRTRLNAFMAEQSRIADEKRRKAEEEARRIREDQERQAREAEEAGRPAPEPIVHVEPVKVAEPVARGDLGSRVGTRTVWKHAVEVPIAKLPKAILENEKVVAAVDQVIAGMVRGGAREIKGVRIYSEQVADVR
jgi:hypothetical protein